MQAVHQRLLWGSMAAILTACAGTGATTKTTFLNDEVDLTRQKRIAFGGAGKLPQGYERRKLPEDLLPIAAEVFRAKMKEKGYEVVADLESADLVLLGGVGVRDEKVREVKNPNSFAFMVEAPPIEVERGAISIEVFTRADGIPVWGGILQGVRRDGPVDVEKFRAALGDLLDRMPPAGTP